MVQNKFCTQEIFIESNGMDLIGSPDTYSTIIGIIKETSYLIKD